MRSVGHFVAPGHDRSATRATRAKTVAAHHDFALHHDARRVVGSFVNMSKGGLKVSYQVDLGRFTAAFLEGPRWRNRHCPIREESNGAAVRRNLGLEDLGILGPGVFGDGVDQARFIVLPKAPFALAVAVLVAEAGSAVLSVFRVAESCRGPCGLVVSHVLI
jgi:hypothetical protein